MTFTSPSQPITNIISELQMEIQMEFVSEMAEIWMIASKIRDSLTFLQGEIVAIKEQLGSRRPTIPSVAVERIQQIESALKEHGHQSGYLENQLTCYNIRIEGIMEADGESWQDCRNASHSLLIFLVCPNFRSSEPITKSNHCQDRLL